MVRRLLILNGLAILGAVVNHSSGWGFTALFWWTDRYRGGAVPDFSELGGGSYYALRAMEQLIIFSIPAFLFVSGFFVAFATGRRRHNVGWNVIGNRIKYLVIPYLLWSVTIFLWKGIEGTVDTPGGYFKQLLLGRAAGPYYYVPLIIQFFLMSLVVVPWMRSHWKPVLLSAGLIQCGALASRYPTILGWDFAPAAWIGGATPGFLFPQTVFWFFFGVYVGFHLEEFKTWLGRWKRVFLPLTAILAVLALFEWEVLFRLSGREWLPPGVTLLDSLYAGCFILTFVAYENARVPARRRLGDLGVASFGIYLMHAPVLELVSRTAYHFMPRLLAHQILFQPALIIAGLGIPMLLMYMVNRSPARPYYKFIFG